MATWFVATMDNSLEFEGETKRECVEYVLKQTENVKPKRERAGQYRYETPENSQGVVTTYYVMTKERAIADGWTDQETLDGYVPLN